MRYLIASFLINFAFFAATSAAHCETAKLKSIKSKPNGQNVHIEVVVEVTGNASTYYDIRVDGWLGAVRKYVNDTSKKTDANGKISYTIVETSVGSLQIGKTYKFYVKVYPKNANKETTKPLATDEMNHTAGTGFEDAPPPPPPPPPPLAVLDDGRETLFDIDAVRISEFH